MEFPSPGKFNTPQLASKILCGAVRDKNEKLPHNKDEVLKQRQIYLVDAFGNIRKETIKKIQKLYYLDFILFGYNNNPPYHFKYYKTTY